MGGFTPSPACSTNPPAFSIHYHSLWAKVKSPGYGKKSLNKVTNSINLTNSSLNVPGQQEEKEVGVSKSVTALSLTLHKLYLGHTGA